MWFIVICMKSLTLLPAIFQGRLQCLDVMNVFSYLPGSYWFPVSVSHQSTCRTLKPKGIMPLFIVGKVWPRPSWKWNRLLRCFLHFYHNMVFVLHQTDPQTLASGLCYIILVCEASVKVNQEIPVAGVYSHLKVQSINVWPNKKNLFISINLEFSKDELKKCDVGKVDCNLNIKTNYVLNMS